MNKILQWLESNAKWPRLQTTAKCNTYIKKHQIHTSHSPYTTGKKVVNGNLHTADRSVFPWKQNTHHSSENEMLRETCLEQPLRTKPTTGRLFSTYRLIAVRHVSLVADKVRHAGCRRAGHVVRPPVLIAGTICNNASSRTATS